LENTLSANVPLWFISLDLSKAFDRVAWPALWEALKAHGISNHLIWVIQTLYHEQEGEISGTGEQSRKFNINAGVRQGSVLSPRLFCCVLQWAMSSWRQKVVGTGWDLNDGLRNLLDLRFADDILLFGKTEAEVLKSLDALVHELSRVGLILNASKTVVLTTQAQAPSSVTSPNGLSVNVIPQNSSQKWLGCMISSSGSNHILDLEYHLQAANRAFYKNRALLTDRATPVGARLRFFRAVVSPVAAYGAG